MTDRSQPWDFGSAMANVNAAKTAQQTAIENFKTASKEAAEAERAYRKKLAERILSNKAEHGSTVAADLARGEPAVADLRYTRDVKAGVRDAAEQVLWKIKDDRRDLGRFIDWSKGVDLAVHARGHEDEPEPGEVTTFGRRAA